MNLRQIVLVVIMVCFVPTLVLAENTKSSAQKTLEIFQSWCLENLDDFTGIDRLAAVVPNVNKMPDDFIQADPAMHRMGGGAYKLKYEGNVYVVVYTNGGGCTVMTGDIDFDNLIGKLVSSFKLGPETDDSAGVYIRKYYKFMEPSKYAGAAIQVSRATPETGYKDGIIGVVSKSALNSATQSQ